MGIIPSRVTANQHNNAGRFHKLPAIGCSHAVLSVLLKQYKAMVLLIWSYNGEHPLCTQASLEAQWSDKFTAHKDALFENLIAVVIDSVFMRGV